LEHLQEGFLELVCQDKSYFYGRREDPLNAVLAVHNNRFFEMALAGGDIGVGESYQEGDWSTPDLVSVIRFGIRNLEQLENTHSLLKTFKRWTDVYSHRRNRNTRKGSKRNIAHHYDLGNDFYRLFLDDSLAYSCAYYDHDKPDDSLGSAQRRKFDLICQKLGLNAQDHLLEIGTGWGGFALYAVQNYGCRVTTTTISRNQHEYARDLISQRGFADERVALLLDDYRNLRGQYDKIVSSEMFEAVGHEYYDEYFAACDRLLKPDGSMLLQTITIQEQRFAEYLRQSDWIRKHVFPGAELASVAEILRSLARVTRMQLFDLEDIGMHYVLTLREWRRRFLDNVSKVRSLGFAEGFVRMWDYYLAYCEAAFSERYISNVQLLISKLTRKNLRIPSSGDQTVVRHVR